MGKRTAERCSKCGRKPPEVKIYTGQNVCATCYLIRRKAAQARKRGEIVEPVYPNLRVLYLENAERAERLAALCEDEVCRRRLLRGAAFWRQASADGSAIAAD